MLTSTTFQWLRKNGYDVAEVKVCGEISCQSADTKSRQNRRHIDLREPGCLDQFKCRFSLQLPCSEPSLFALRSDQNIKFAFFLACEVGGSKFIDNTAKNVQLQIIEHNVLIYQHVFKWLGAPRMQDSCRTHVSLADEQRVPFVFTSSYLQTQVRLHCCWFMLTSTTTRSQTRTGRSNG
jgi:hypothetical protein